MPRRRKQKLIKILVICIHFSFDIIYIQKIYKKYKEMGEFTTKCTHLLRNILLYYEARKVNMCQICQRGGGLAHINKQSKIKGREITLGKQTEQDHFEIGIQ